MNRFRAHETCCVWTRSDDNGRSAVVSRRALVTGRGGQTGSKAPRWALGLSEAAASSRPSAQMACNRRPSRQQQHNRSQLRWLQLLGLMTCVSTTGVACGNGCLEGPIPASTCAAYGFTGGGGNLPNCHYVSVNSYCEGDGECGTNNWANNCNPGSWDIYRIVPCNSHVHNPHSHTPHSHTPHSHTPHSHTPHSHSPTPRQRTSTESPTFRPSSSISSIVMSLI